MTWLPYLIVVLLLGGMFVVTTRNRRRQAVDEVVRASRIEVGTEVMTTSGLYATVVARHDDGTVLLSIAPGVEVTWAAAALRDAASLSETYRRFGFGGDRPHRAAAQERRGRHADLTVPPGRGTAASVILVHRVVR